MCASYVFSYRAICVDIAIDRSSGVKFYERTCQYFAPTRRYRLSLHGQEIHLCISSYKHVLRTAYLAWRIHRLFPIDCWVWLLPFFTQTISLVPRPTTLHAHHSRNKLTCLKNVSRWRNACGCTNILTDNLANLHAHWVDYKSVQYIALCVILL